MGRFFIKRPIFAIVIAILTVLIGAVSATRLPIAQYPNIVPPEIQVTTTFTGADAVTIEKSVATPIEQTVNGVDRALYLRSINSNDNTFTLRVTFAVDSNIDTDNMLVQNRVTQAQPLLPSDVNAYGITVRKSVSSPLLIFSVYSPNGTYDPVFLGNYITININDELLRLPGVGQTNQFGASTYAMRVWVRPDQLQTLGLTVADLKNAISRQSTVNPAGQVGGEPAPPGQEFTYAIRAQGRLVTAEEFGNVIVRENPDGSVVRLRDVSRVELGVETYDQRARFNGRPAGIIAVYQTPGSNAIEVANAAKKKMDELKKRFPADVAYATSMDTTIPVVEGIRDVIKTLLEAFALVIVVVFVFLQNWRATIIPLCTVPVSLIGTFAFFPILGFSINTLSLFGLVLAIGLVIDDAIIMVEGVEHHIEEGMSPVEAANAAVDELSAPVVSVAFVLASVFVPVAFIGGITGRLYQQFALTIALSVAISAFNALSLSPALCSLMLRPRTEKRRRGPLARFFGLFNRVFDWSKARYLAGSSFLARHLAVGLGLLLVFFALAAVLGKKTPSGFITEEDQGYAFVNVELPVGASLQRTDEVCKQAEKILAETPGVRMYNTIAGFSLLSLSNATYAGFFFVSFQPYEERKTKETVAEGIVTALNQKFYALPGATVVAFGPPAIQGLGIGAGFDMFLQDRSGSHTPQEIEGVTRHFIEAGAKRPEVGRIMTTYRASVPQIFAHVDRDKVLKEGVDIGDVYATLQAFMGSTYINNFNRFGRQWRVYMAGAPEYRATANKIEDFYVRSKTNQMVPLSSFVRTENIVGPQFTNRYNLFSAAEVTGIQAPGYSAGQVTTALEEVARETLPGDFGFEWTALSYQQVTAPSATGAFVLALIFVFLILAALYESWSIPWSVLLGTPVAAVGAFAGLMVQRMPFNVYAQIGLIMLIGLTAKNAILIVEFAKAELDRGRAPLDAALVAAGLRLRPILMTSFAFVFGCVPLLIASGSGAVSRKILGTVVVYGMLAATLIANFITPALFVAVQKMLAFFARRREHRGGPPSHPVAGGGTVTPGDGGPV